MIGFVNQLECTYCAVKCHLQYSAVSFITGGQQYKAIMTVVMEDEDSGAIYIEHFQLYKRIQNFY